MQFYRLPFKGTKFASQSATSCSYPFKKNSIPFERFFCAPYSFRRSFFAPSPIAAHFSLKKTTMSVRVLLLSDYYAQKVRFFTAFYPSNRTHRAGINSGCQIVPWTFFHRFSVFAACPNRQFSANINFCTLARILNQRYKNFLDKSDFLPAKIFIDFPRKKLSVPQKISEPHYKLLFAPDTLWSYPLFIFSNFLPRPRDSLKYLKNYVNSYIHKNSAELYRLSFESKKLHSQTVPKTAFPKNLIFSRKPKSFDLASVI